MHDSVEGYSDVSISTGWLDNNRTDTDLLDLGVATKANDTRSLFVRSEVGSMRGDVMSCPRIDHPARSHSRVKRNPDFFIIIGYLGNRSSSRYYDMGIDRFARGSGFILILILIFLILPALLLIIPLLLPAHVALVSSLLTIITFDLGFVRFVARLLDRSDLVKRGGISAPAFLVDEAILQHLWSKFVGRMSSQDSGSDGGIGFG